MASSGQLYDDMCNMDILNEPEVLSNIIGRYRNDTIFTFIGPTLVVINPYALLPEYFGPEAMSRIRTKVLENNTQTEKPHIFLIAGSAFTSMTSQQKKQAIVISGESGAGKTESTKYCMQFLASLSHLETLPI
jgi:myosin heavy subunit